eukprot:6234938-Amphidinium_carterae.1
MSHRSTDNFTIGLDAIPFTHHPGPHHALMLSSHHSKKQQPWRSKCRETNLRCASYLNGQCHKWWFVASQNLGQKQLHRQADASCQLRLFP